MRVLLTGAAGFAGSYIAEAIANEGGHVVALDCLTYAGKLSNLTNVSREQLTFVCHDFRTPLTQHLLDYIGPVDCIIHNGAETHVASSFENPELFVQSNVVGTLNMLEAARILKPHVFLYVSTDEVFGQSDGCAFKEEDSLNPSNPYSASKAAGEMLVRAYHKSYHLSYLITRTTNMFGKRQHEEKYIPMTIGKFQRNEVVEVHANGDGKIGSRQWIHASDQASAILYILKKSDMNETLHIAGVRKDNLEVARAIGQGTIRVTNAYNRWPGHDLDYNLDDSRIRNIGWKPKLTFEQGLELTIS